MEKVRVLLVEDDQRLGELQRDYLTQQGIEVSWLKNGLAVGLEVDRFLPDVIVLDLLLPGGNGLDICKSIRQRFKGCIVFLTASDDDIDQVTCIELGADDYITKPIQPRVLLARIRMALRRQESAAAAVQVDVGELSYGHLWLKNNTREVTLCGRLVKLSYSEFILLWSLASRPDEVVGRALLFRRLRGIEFGGVDRSVDTKIVSLRKKLEDNRHAPRKIVTIRNQGYMFCSDAWD